MTSTDLHDQFSDYSAIEAQSTHKCFFSEWYFIIERIFSVDTACTTHLDTAKLFITKWRWWWIIGKFHIRRIFFSSTSIFADFNFAEWIFADQVFLRFQYRRMILSPKMIEYFNIINQLIVIWLGNCANWWPLRLVVVYFGNHQSCKPTDMVAN